ncbi:MAG: anti-sigma factor [Drouetiella hepatica Uher 2000/2452]|uniref:Regulator of SigK n=1 Tax=Drouetiella hepatica Uher 2000/2452 TaxID=904376 RepID=A0A951Q8R7_9CYAN|nr:anti-sigma factor [Drouetiella hepatica Uher 2000/2452]
MTSALPSNWQELIAGYALGDLSPEEAEELQHLLAENPDLIAEVASLQEVLALMPYGLSQQVPSTQLRDSILMAVEASSAMSNSFTDSPTRNRFVDSKDNEPNNRSIASLQAIGGEDSGLPSRRRSAWYGIGGTIAAVALVALGIDNYRLRQETQQAKSVIAALQQRGTQTIALEGTQEANAASGSLLIAESRQVFMVAKDLPVLPEGQVYRLWAMPSSGKNPAFCGQFSAKTNGSVTTQWVTPEVSCQSTTVQMLITSEKASDPPLPKGSLVMQSRI